MAGGEAADEKGLDWSLLMPRSEPHTVLQESQLFGSERGRQVGRHVSDMIHRAPAGNTSQLLRRVTPLAL